MVRSRWLLCLLALGIATAQTERINPFANNPEAAEFGRVAFRGSCGACHGIKAEGGRAPDLRLGNFAAGDSDAAIFKVINEGVPGTEMPGFGARYEADDIWRIVAYVRSIANRAAAAPAGDREAGSRLFWDKVKCGQCHMVNGKGGRMGPELTYGGGPQWEKSRRRAEELG
jgi:cbb3-type cytochrome c oxidase subunit III